MAERILTSMNEAASLVSEGDKLLLIGGFEPIALIAKLIEKNKGTVDVTEYGNTLSAKLIKAAGQLGLHIYADNDDDRRMLRKQLIAGASGFSYASVKPTAAYKDRLPEYCRSILDPFTGEESLVMAALRPDVALIHVARADVYGNVQLDPTEDFRRMETIRLALAAKKIIVTAEQIVSDRSIEMNEKYTVLDAKKVVAVVEAPYGAFPCSYASRYKDAGKEAEQIVKELPEMADWEDYLGQIGIAKLMEITINRRGV